MHSSVVTVLLPEIVCQIGMRPSIGQLGGQGRRERNKCSLEIIGCRIVKFSPYVSEVRVDMVSRFAGMVVSEEEGRHSAQLLSSYRELRMDQIEE